MLFELSRHYGNGTLLLKDIAQKQRISEKYLSKLVIPLKGTGILDAVRGAAGGYRLAKHPKNITLLEVVQLLEGDIAPVDCLYPNRNCPQEPSCPSRFIWEALDSSMRNTLKDITLQDMLDRYQQQVEEQIMYYI